MGRNFGTLKTDHLIQGDHLIQYCLLNLTVNVKMVLNVLPFSSHCPIEIHGHWTKGHEKGSSEGKKYTVSCRPVKPGHLLL